MKYLFIIIVLFLAACNPESSPEGRMNIKMKKMEQKIDSLKAGHDALRDSIILIKKQINALERQQ